MASVNIIGKTRTIVTATLEFIPNIVGAAACWPDDGVALSPDKLLFSSHYNIKTFYAFLTASKNHLGTMSWALFSRKVMLESSMYVVAKSSALRIDRPYDCARRSTVYHVYQRWSLSFIAETFLSVRSG